jgi:nitroimidazol reductase NimA-like FMN-containing flavoprotein (pyridoxamine 5'-phosphate oxidase superfamily)
MHIGSNFHGRIHMQHEMRRAKRALSEEEAREILEEGIYGVLSTVDLDGEPYGTPISYVVVDGKIYFHSTNQGGHKVSNLEANPLACFTVVDGVETLPSKFSSLYQSAIAFGTVKPVEDENKKEAALLALLEKYSADFIETGKKYLAAMRDKTLVYEFEIDRITGKSNR